MSLESSRRDERERERGREEGRTNGEAHVTGREEDRLIEGEGERRLAYEWVKVR